MRSVSSPKCSACESDVLCQQEAAIRQRIGLRTADQSTARRPKTTASEVSTEQAELCAKAQNFLKAWQIHMLANQINQRCKQV